LTIRYDYRRHVAELGITLTAKRRLGTGTLVPELLQHHQSHQTPEPSSIRLTANIALPPKHHQPRRQHGKSDPRDARK